MYLDLDNNVISENYVLFFSVCTMIFGENEREILENYQRRLAGLGCHGLAPWPVQLLVW